MSARSALKIEIGYGQMREIIWIWGQTREILPLGQTCEISEARHRHTTHPCLCARASIELQLCGASTMPRGQACVLVCGLLMKMRAVVLPHYELRRAHD